ncbi:Rhotekin [Collichthys lucidus]|uniref:Rhotekin n=1 Tax=Collichthys lucidus TaxID=240159 RepID=A0A4U5V9Z4_COLLU|nr:Rhotekin [Collichthys lucidus]
MNDNTQIYVTKRRCKSVFAFSLTSGRNLHAEAQDRCIPEVIGQVSDQDEEVLKRIEREVRMREGASKLLAACSRRDQALEASKSLLTCNARILALLSQLQRMRKAQALQRAGRRPSEVIVPCLGKVAISDLRIPLMWKDSEYFKNKGELHRCAVFCLLQCGTEIHDTDLLMVDRTLTDICFEDTIIFNEASPEFQLRVELYSTCVAVEDFFPGALGPRRLSRLGGSLGRSSGRKIRAAFESATVCGSSGGDEGSGRLGEDLNCWRNVYGVLKGQSLLCYQCQEELESEDEPLLVIHLKKDTLVCLSETDPVRCQSLYISTRHQGQDVTYTLTAHTPEDTQRWTVALWQHVYNMIIDDLAASFTSVARTRPFHSRLLRLVMDVNVDMINGAIWKKAAEDTSFSTIFYLSTGNFNRLA